MENQLQWFEKIENVYRHLQDEESRVLFNARFYFFENREEDFFDVVGSYYHDWKYAVVGMMGKLPKGF